MNSFCGGTAFNVIPAASAFTTVAGLISGFMFAGMIMLLAEHRKGVQGLHIPTLIQFFAGFVSLGFCAYLFGLISGEHAEACRRVWTVVAMSSGMLAAGVIAAVGGVVTLVNSFLHAQVEQRPGDPDRPALDRDRRMAQFGKLQKLLELAFVLVAMVTTALLLARNIEATWVWLGDDLWKAGMIIGVAGVIGAIGVVAVGILRRSPERSGSPDPHCDRLFVGAVITVLYTLATTVVVGAALSLFNGDWNNVSAWWAVLPIGAGTLAPILTIWYVVQGVRGLLRSPGTPGRPAVTGADPRH